MGISLVKRRKHFCLQPKTCMYVSFVSKPWRICCKLIHSYTYTTIQTIFYLGAFNRNYNYGAGNRLRSINLQHMMSLLVTGNRLRMILWPSGFLVLALPWMCFMEILFAAKMITSSWTTSSPITYITLILWVLAKKKLGLMNCLVVLNRFLSIHPLPPPWTVEPTCILLIDSPFFLELILFVS